MSELLKKITEAQLEIQNAKFDATGQQGHRTFPYATLGECLDVVNAVLKPRGLVIWFDINDDQVCTVVTDGNEEIRRSPFPVSFTDDPRANGSEVTYAKRYSLQAAFGITSEDDDGEFAQKVKEPTVEPETVKPKTVKKISENNGKNSGKPETVDYLMLAKSKCMKILKEKHSGNVEDAKAEFTKFQDEDGYIETPEWFEKKHKELLTEMRAK